MKYTIKTFRHQFPDDDACLDWLRHRRWPERIACAKCGKANKFHRVRSRKVYECDYCGFQISPTAGTILHKSPTPLTHWFYAMFLMASTRTGISAKQLERELGVTYKTAWRMFSQIRKLMAEDVGGFTGGIEADETYIGGKRSGEGRGPGGKTIAFGIVGRNGGRVMTQIVPNVKARTLLPVLWKHVPAYKGTRVYTDELASYNLLPKLGYVHGRVNHSQDEFVRGEVHTNTIDGFWSLVKRSIDGVHHSVSPKHLQSYLNSFAFRYNRRHSPEPMFAALADRLPAPLA